MAEVDQPGYVDVDSLNSIAKLTETIKRRTYEILQLAAGQSVLDVGCGPGIDTVNMARLVGERGTVRGIDCDKKMLLRANDRAISAGVQAWTKHDVGRAESLPYDAAAFDACRSERLFQHVDNAKAVMDEMVRVAKPGGLIAVADTDWSTLSIDTEEVDLGWRLARFRADHYSNGYAGRQLYRLFREARLVNIEVEAHPIIWTDYDSFHATSFSVGGFERQAVESGAVTEEELGRFLRSLEAAQASGCFFACGTIILVYGTRNAAAT